MSLKIKAYDRYIDLDSFSFDKGSGTIRKVSSDPYYGSGIILELPFRINKIPDKIFDIKEDIDQILILNNSNFGELNWINLRMILKGKSESVGYIFTLKGLIENSDLTLDNRSIQLFGARAVTSLMYANTNYSVEIPEYNDEGYSLYDFYPENSIICVISKERFEELTDLYIVSILYKLSFYGFSLWNNVNDSFADNSQLQKDVFVREIGNSGHCNIQVDLIDGELYKEAFVGKYIKVLRGRKVDILSRYLLCYQIFEILIDLVTKLELQAKICNVEDGGDRSGYDLRKIVTDIGKESYRMKKLFSHYCDFKFESDYQTCYYIDLLFSDLLDEELNDRRRYGLIFYAFRNKIVHNLRIIHGSKEETVMMEYLYNIVEYSEYVASEAVVTFNRRGT